MRHALTIGTGTKARDTCVALSHPDDLLHQVLKKVMQHEIAESFFNEPVDPDALGIPEYRDFVQVNPAFTHGSSGIIKPFAPALLSPRQ